MSVSIMNNYIESSFNPRNPRAIAQLLVLYAIIILGFPLFNPRFYSYTPVTPPVATLLFSASGEGAGGAPPARGRPPDHERQVISYMNFNPLNPLLYDYLDQFPGGVKRVENAGQRMEYTIVPNGKWRSIRPDFSGEEYVINCPICGDKRGRCYVNHTVGTKIEGITVYHLIHCFNEGCDSEISKLMREEMKNGGWGSSVVSLAGRKSPALTRTGNSKGVIASPEMTIPTHPLSEVGCLHPAVVYVTERGFDAKFLGNYFGVGLFKGNPHVYPTAIKRLIVPVVFNNSMVGWTARSVPGYTAKKWEDPKYLHSKGFAKSKFLYNYDSAKDSPVIAVVEGVTDVWKIGTWGMALFGKDMSDAQCQLLCRAAEDKGTSIVLLADAADGNRSVTEDWEKNYHKLRSAYRYPDRIFLHHMEQGDPGDCSSQELYDLVNNIVHERKI